MVERTSPNIVRVVVEGEPIKSAIWNPGDKVKVDVGGGELRSYTPSRVDLQAGTFEFFAVLYGQGAGAAFANRVQPGDLIRYFGPKGSLKFPEQKPQWAVFFGDESTIGVAKSCLSALAPEVNTLGALEIDDDDMGGVSSLGLPLELLPRSGERGQVLVDHLATLDLPRDKPGVVWLSGEATSVLALRQAILDRGITKDQLSLKAYWSIKGKAHRKKLEMGVLR